MATAMLSNDSATQLQFEILSETLADTYECYSDLYAEHLNEIALFGDSWPGASVTLAGIRESIAIMEAEQLRLASFLGLLAEHGPNVPFDPTTEEPF
jgi:hypothetical protein